MDRARPSLFLVVLFVAATCLPSCAPKKVTLYDTPGIGQEVVSYAVGLVGKPYRLGGKGPEVFDCSGLVQFAFRKAGFDLPPTTEGLRQSGREISRDVLRPGDLVFFSIKKDSHVGIVVNRSQFVHASKSRGVAIDDLDAPYWRKKVVGFRSVL
jgi:cell wall-associated NlpC family hydrolase